MLELFTLPETWLSLITLTVMEIVLGIDNVIFISLVTSRLGKSDQEKARKIGLFLALFIRVILLAFISYIVNEMTDPIVTIIDHPISWRDIILLLGGLFLIYKSTLEIYEVLEAEGDHKNKNVNAVFWNIVFQVILIDIVFSFDSIITAVGLAQHLPVMVLAVVISMFIMLFFSKYISDFINKHPSIKLLALAFLVVIGVLLIISGWDEKFSEDVNLKSYLYFAMAFSVGIELLNMRMRKGGKDKKPVKLKDIYK
ncbi:MAG: TerC family protein [Bacteroidia bacterium]|jgi:predicted tellurium resistance membrane protein TerC